MSLCLYRSVSRILYRIKALFNESKRKFTSCRPLSYEVVDNNMADSSKCVMPTCNRSVKVVSCHKLCNSHRSCNNEGKYDPVKCAMCQSLFAQANSGTHLAASSKNNLSNIFASMQIFSIHSPPRMGRC